MRSMTMAILAVIMIFTSTLSAQVDTLGFKGADYSTLIPDSFKTITFKEPYRFVKAVPEGIWNPETLLFGEVNFPVGGYYKVESQVTSDQKIIDLRGYRGNDSTTVIFKNNFGLESAMLKGSEVYGTRKVSLVDTFRLPKNEWFFLYNGSHQRKFCTLGDDTLEVSILKARQHQFVVVTDVKDDEWLTADGKPIATKKHGQAHIHFSTGTENVHTISFYKRGLQACEKKYCFYDGFVSETDTVFIPFPHEEAAEQRGDNVVVEVNFIPSCKAKELRPWVGLESYRWGQLYHVIKDTTSVTHPTTEAVVGTPWYMNPYYKDKSVTVKVDYSSGSVKRFSSGLSLSTLGMLKPPMEKNTMEFGLSNHLGQLGGYFHLARYRVDSDWANVVQLEYSPQVAQYCVFEGETLIDNFSIRGSAFKGEHLIHENGRERHSRVTVAEALVGIPFSATSKARIRIGGSYDMMNLRPPKGWTSNEVCVNVNNNGLYSYQAALTYTDNLLWMAIGWKEEKIWVGEIQPELETYYSYNLEWLKDYSVDGSVGGAFLELELQGSFAYLSMKGYFHVDHLKNGTLPDGSGGIWTKTFQANAGMSWMLTKKAGMRLDFEWSVYDFDHHHRLKTTLSLSMVRWWENMDKIFW